MKRINGFSLMEMMIVLMIVAIVMAASAPMITKKTARTNSSPWIWNGNNIQFNQLGNNSTAVIGDNNGGNLNSRLRIRTSNSDVSHISFSSGAENSVGMNLFAGSGRNIWLSNNVPGSDPSNTIAIGVDAKASGDGNIVIGNGAEANNNYTIAIGKNANATGTNSIAIGSLYNNQKTIATAANSVAIGNGAVANEKNTIVLGTKDTTVIIPGHLVVMGDTLLGGNMGANTYIRENMPDGAKFIFHMTEGSGVWSNPKNQNTKKGFATNQRYVVQINEKEYRSYPPFTHPDTSDDDIDVEKGGGLR